MVLHLNRLADGALRALSLHSSLSEVAAAVLFIVCIARPVFQTLTTLHIITGFEISDVGCEVCVQEASDGDAIERKDGGFAAEVRP